MNFIHTGTKIGLNQHYIVVWCGYLVFVVHDEKADVIKFNSLVRDRDRRSIEKFVRKNLTNQ